MTYKLSDDQGHANNAAPRNFSQAFFIPNFASNAQPAQNKTTQENNDVKARTTSQLDVSKKSGAEISWVFNNLNSVEYRQPSGTKDFSRMHSFASNVSPARSESMNLCKDVKTVYVIKNATQAAKTAK